ncbi:hypothetical protein SVA_2614 [Sulfurifustis variabilis]|uniref:Uncharacterized protein n=1 Tax=Sulfurifustis variabilis TaxID=1675686 RepID=A0A1B4V944_9GAMM|nr:hypothetical protein [Sulfurifustis variabilis]BAU49162.1 hypothetical protein SVA_2614 [Sulfurifustis variabilis]
MEIDTSKASGIEPPATTSIPEFPSSPKEHVFALLNWLYRNVFFGLITAIMSLVSYLLAKSQPMIETKQLVIGLAILSITICMTNTSFTAELRSFLNKQQEMVSNLASFLAFIVFIIAAYVTFGADFNELAAGMAVTVSFILSVVVGYHSHNIGLRSRALYVEAVIAEVRQKDREGYREERIRDERSLIEQEKIGTREELILISATTGL